MLPKQHFINIQKSKQRTYNNMKNNKAVFEYIRLNIRSKRAQA